MSASTSPPAMFLHREDNCQRLESPFTISILAGVHQQSSLPRMMMFIASFNHVQGVYFYLFTHRVTLKFWLGPARIVDSLRRFLRSGLRGRIATGDQNLRTDLQHTTPFSR